MDLKVNPKVSVILSTHDDGKKYLEKTIPSIKAQDYKDLEIIVVDNGSDTETSEYLKSVQGITLVVSPVLHAKNFACNKAAQVATGEFFFLTDNDVVFSENSLISQLVEEYFSLINPGCITTAYINEGYDKSQGYGAYLGHLFNLEIPSLSKNEIAKLHGSKVGYPHGIGIFISKQTWDQIHGYDDFIGFGGDDNDLGIKIYAMGLNCYLYSKTIQTHIGHVKNDTIDGYCYRLKSLFYAHLVTITKDYSLRNMLIAVPAYSIVMFLRSIKQSLKRKSIKPLSAVIHSILKYISQLKNILKKRKEFQRSRIIKRDIFLDIRPNFSTLRD